MINIQRYLLREKNKGELFGDIKSSILEYGWEWYFGDKKIGIVPRPTTESEVFYGGFLSADDELIVTKSNKYPGIERAKESMGRIDNHEKGPENLKKLVELILSESETFVFLTFRNQKNSRPEILTFSKEKPTDELYVPGKVLPIKVKSSYRDELEKRMEEYRQRHGLER